MYISWILKGWTLFESVYIHWYIDSGPGHRRLCWNNRHRWSRSRVITLEKSTVHRHSQLPRQSQLIQVQGQVRGGAFCTFVYIISFSSSLLRRLGIDVVQSMSEAGNRFTKALTQNVNLHTHLKVDYNIKSLNYIQKNYRFQASFLLYWTLFIYLCLLIFWHAQWFKHY